MCLLPKAPASFRINQDGLRVAMVGYSNNDAAALAASCDRTWPEPQPTTSSGIPLAASLLYLAFHILPTTRLASAGGGQHVNLIGTALEVLTHRGKKWAF